MVEAEVGNVDITKSDELVPVGRGIENPKAPLSQVGDEGVVEDILAFIPDLTKKIEKG